MKMFSRGAWRSTAETAEVRNPFDGSVVDAVPVADAAEVDAALTVLADGAAVMRAMNPRDRADILRRASEKIAADPRPWGERICAEGGKPIRDATGEANRAAETLRLCATEAERIGGEVLPDPMLLRTESGRAGLHPPRAVRGRGGGHAVQLPAEPRLP